MPEGKIRSASRLTEPPKDAPSPDRHTIESSHHREAIHYVSNGHKWWTSGNRRSVPARSHLQGKTEQRTRTKYKQQSRSWVPRTRQASRVVRMLTVFGL